MRERQTKSDDLNERAPRRRVTDGARKVRMLGFVGILLVLGLQLPLIIASFAHGMDFSPGRTGLQSTWVSVVIVMDVCVMIWWSFRRPSKPIHAVLPAVLILAFASCAALPLALFLRVLWAEIVQHF